MLTWTCLEVFICLSQARAQLSAQLSSENMMSPGRVRPGLGSGSAEIKDQPSANQQVGVV